jgi:hypothetical protein
MAVREKKALRCRSRVPQPVQIPMLLLASEES